MKSPMYDFVFFTDVTSVTVNFKAIGAYKCAHVLRLHGYTCLVVDHLHSFTYEEFVKCIELSVGPNTKAVGFSTTFLRDVSTRRDLDWYRPSEAIEDIIPPIPFGNIFPQGIDFETNVLNFIKSHNQQCKIIIGGLNTSPGHKNKFIDYVFIGFSEMSIVNFADHLTTGIKLTNSFKNPWGVTIIKDKEAVGYDFKNSSFAWEKSDVLNAAVLPIEIARGCIFKCKFCSYQMNGKKNLDFIRDSNLIYEELQSNFDKFGISNYYIIDDTFNDSDVKLDAMLMAIKKLSFKPLFWAYIRLDLIARDVSSFQKLYDIGLRACFFGIETLHPPTGRIVGKGYSREKQISAIKHIREKYPDVLMHGSFIIGLPGETMESCTQTFFEISTQNIPLHSFTFGVLHLDDASLVTWSSELTVNFDEYGYKKLPNAVNQKGINWRNAYTTREEAAALAAKFNAAALTLPKISLSGHMIWGVLDFFNNYMDISKLSINDIDWNNLQKKKMEFVATYKQQLFNLLQITSE